MITLISIIILITAFVVFKNHRKYIFLGLGTSGINVTKAWIKRGGKGFTLLDKKYSKEKRKFNRFKK